MEWGALKLEKKLQFVSVISEHKESLVGEQQYAEKPRSGITLTLYFVSK